MNAIFYFHEFLVKYSWQSSNSQISSFFILFPTSLAFYLNFSDSFWGWSTAACLCFPCGLIALSRDAKQTREENLFEVWWVLCLRVILVWYAVLHCGVLYCVVVYCIVLWCVVVYCIILYCFVVCCIALYCVVLVLFCFPVSHCVSLDCTKLLWREIFTG